MYGPQFTEALVYAAELHRAQIRKGSGVPYVTHLLAVAALVGEHGGSEDEVIAGLLHDAVEDQGGLPRLADIRARFGDAVAHIVWGCTDAETTPKPPWRERKEAYVAHLAEASPSIRLVSSSDKLHNARAILADLRVLGPAIWDRFTGGRDGVLWYYRALADTFLRLSPGPLAEELARTVAEIEVLSAEC